MVEQRGVMFDLFSALHVLLSEEKVYFFRLVHTSAGVCVARGTRSMTAICMRGAVLVAFTATFSPQRV